MGLAGWWHRVFSLQSTQALDGHLFTCVLPEGAHLCWPHTLVSLLCSFRAQDPGFLNVCPELSMIEEWR